MSEKARNRRWSSETKIAIKAVLECLQDGKLKLEDVKRHEKKGTLEDVPVVQMAEKREEETLKRGGKKSRFNAVREDWSVVSGSDEESSVPVKKKKATSVPVTDVRTKFNNLYDRLQKEAVEKKPR